ncbi:TIGR04141 family sporadically distributed protein [Chromobacterium violaceum]
MKNSNSREVSLYLLKEKYFQDFQAMYALKQKIPLLKGLPFNGYFVPLPDIPEPPDWVDSIRLLVEASTDLGLNSQYPAGLLYILFNDKHFVFSFGHAWRSLKSEWVDQDFGKRVALNSIPQGQLSELKAEQVFAAWHLSSERSPAPSSLSSFNLESDRDLVHAIEGKPRAEIAKIIGTSIRGGISLRFSVDFSKMQDALSVVCQLGDADDYIRIWPELDNLRLIKDDLVIEGLDSSLDEFLKSGMGLDKLNLIAPTLKNSELPFPSSFWIGRLGRKGNSGQTTNPYLSIHSWLFKLEHRKLNPAVEIARSDKVHFFDSDGEELATVSVYDCIAYESSINRDEKSIGCVLSGGRWYEVSFDFIESINRELDQINVVGIAPLREWDGILPEGDYNRQCENISQGLLLFDAKNIFYGGGKSQFEFCDLYDVKSKTLFFVKHIGSSSHCSHLSEQMRRTVDNLFGIDGEFRSKLKEKMGAEYPDFDTDWLDSRPRSFDFNLCVVSMGKNLSDFPFFAKCGLARVVKDLKRRDFNISFVSV